MFEWDEKKNKKIWEESRKYKYLLRGRDERDKS